MRYGQRLFTGIVGLLLVALVIVTPGYIVSKTHDLETGGKNVLSFSEVVEGTEAGEVTYNPYREMNDTTAGIMSGYPGQMTGGVYRVSGIYYPGTMNYNINGYADTIAVTGTPDLTSIFMKLDMAEMHENNINIIYLSFSCEANTYINEFKVIRTNPDYTYDGNTDLINEVPTVLKSSGLETKTGFINLSETLMNTLASTTSAYTEDHILLRIGFNGVINIMTFNLQISPLYYEVSEGGSSSSTTGNTTLYVPIDYKMGYYDIRSASFLVGGILILVTALCSTTLINPSNILKGKKRLI